MDAGQIGKLIFKLRTENRLTQLQLAEKLHISDKTVSKWERGQGCPDISLITQLSEIFHISPDALLSGSMDQNLADTGNLRRIKFYVCPHCGGVLNTTGNAELSCCGRKLFPLIAKSADSLHRPSLEEVEDELFISFSHPMNREHYISFVAAVASDRLLLVKLYPEQNAELRLPRMPRPRLYYYCSEHGLFMLDGLGIGRRSAH